MSAKKRSKRAVKSAKKKSKKTVVKKRIAPKKVAARKTAKKKSASKKAAARKPVKKKSPAKKNTTKKTPKKQARRIVFKKIGGAPPSPEYVRGISLQAGDAYRKRSAPGFGAAEETLQLKEGEEQAFIAEKSLVSFASSVSKQSREDIIQSTLLAQLAANKKVGDPEQILEWYTKFVEVLSNTGWVIEGTAVQEYKSDESIFEVENVIIDLLTAAFGASFITIIKKTLEAIKSLSSADNKLKIFEKKVTTTSKGCFQIALANETDGVISLQMGTFLITTSAKMTKIIFFKSTKDKTQVKYISRKGTLSSTMYAKIREAVTTKLGDKIISNVAELEI